MNTKPIKGFVVERREFLRVVATCAVITAAEPLSATAAKADNEKASERAKARYRANSADVQAFYRVNRYLPK